MNIVSLNRIVLPVSNSSLSADWFQRNFDLPGRKAGRVFGNPAVELSFQKYGIVLMETDLLNRYSHIPLNFHTNRIHEMADSLASQGVRVTPMSNDEGMLCCDFYDPDGNRLGLVYETEGDDSAPNIQVGGTFLTVRSLDASVEWYRNHLGYDFSFFDADGSAGYEWEPTDGESVVIRYAGVNADSLIGSSWSGMCLVETPEYFPLKHCPYTLLSRDARSDYEELKKRDVRVSEWRDDDGISFIFYDLDGHPIGIEQV